jgi:hypothetical protein
MKSLQFVSCIYINILGTWDSSLLFLSQILARNEMPWTVVFGVARRSTAVVCVRSIDFFVFFRLFFSVQNSGLEIGTTPTTILDTKFKK